MCHKEEEDTCVAYEEEDTYELGLQRTYNWLMPLSSKETYTCQKRPTHVSKETYTCVKRDPHMCQKKPTHYRGHTAG